MDNGVFLIFGWVYNKGMDTSQLHTLFLIIHLFGVALGAGGAFMSDGAFFASLKDRKISKDEFGILKITSQMTWVGLILLLVSGAGLFAMNPEVLSASTKFLREASNISSTTSMPIIPPLFRLK